MRCVVLDGKRYPIREVLKLYKEQKAYDRKARQLVLFDLIEDSRPRSQQHAAGRYQEPTLF